MRIVKLRTSLGAEGTTKAGQVLEVSEQRGRDLIRLGYARLLREGEVIGSLTAPVAGARRGGAPVPAIQPGKPGKGAKGVPVSGPLALTKTPDGFRIGPAPSPSSSAPVQAPAASTSRKRGGKGSASSASTRAGS